MTPAEVIRGDAPVVLGQPHGGTWLPDDVAARLNERGRDLADTDWHIDRLYDGLLPGATVVRACFHRYLVDPNRDPAGASLYPGQNTTGLCPVVDFDGEPIWRPGQEPGPDEVARRVRDWHSAYHATLEVELTRVRARHGRVLLWDCHSIRSVIPFLFDGTLPVLNVGTDGGRTCDAGIVAAVVAGCETAPGDSVLNGRFRGGWTTRHYGRPEQGIHAIQMETAQRGYMEEAPPWRWDEERAAELRETLSRLLAAACEALPPRGNR